MSSVRPAAQPCGRGAPPPGAAPPARPAWEVADVFRLYGEAYRRAHPLPPAHRRVMSAIERCRTAALGGHVERCDACGFERVAYNSCRNRHCPKCQALAKARWLEARRAELLPVRYFHVVFTLPHELNPLALANKQQVYGLLFRAAAQTSVYSVRSDSSAGNETMQSPIAPGRIRRRRMETALSGCPPGGEP